MDLPVSTEWTANDRTAPLQGISSSVSQVKDRSAAVIGLALADTGLKRIDHPLARHYLRVTLGLGIDEPANSGRSSELETAQDELEAELTGMAVLAGRVTWRRERVIHFDCDDPDRVGAIAKGWAAKHRAFRLGLRWRLTPLGSSSAT